MNDGELLGRWKGSGDRAAMDALVRRHVDFVYATARRELGDAHQAEDVTQAVFLLLARKSGSISGERLSGWLFQTTRYAAANARKVALRRAYHERQAARQRSESLVHISSPDPDPRPLIPLLNDALASLKPAEREAVILRYLQGREIAAVCSQVGGSEAAVRKRISRAVEKLRDFMSARGIAANGTSPVIAALSVAAGEKAPPALAATALSAACGAATPAAVSISKSAVLVAGLQKAKVAALLAIGVTAVAVVGSQLARMLPAPRRVSAPVVAMPPATRPSGDPNAYAALERIRQAMTPPGRRYYTAFHADQSVERTDAKGVRPTEVDESRFYRSGENIDVAEEIRMHWPGHDPVDRVIGRRAIAGKSFVEYDALANEFPKRALFNPDGLKMQCVAIAYLGGGNDLEGYVAGDDLPFWEFLGDYSDLHVGTEDEPRGATQPVGQRSDPALHLWGKGSRGRYDLWCDPQTYALRRAKVVKSDGDKVWWGSALGRPLFPGGKQFLDAFWFEMDVTKVAGDGDVRRIDEALLTTYQHYNSGQQITSHGTVHRTAFEPNPDFAARGAFRPHLREGTPMSGLNLPGGGKFVWRGGRVELLPGTAAPGSLYAALQPTGATAVPMSWPILDVPQSGSDHAVASSMPARPALVRAGRGARLLVIAAIVIGATGLGSIGALLRRRSGVARARGA